MKVKTILISAGIGLAPGLLLAFLVGGSREPLRLCSNALFFGGILLLVYALFEWTLHLGFYNGVSYAFRKIREAFRHKDYDPKKSELKSRPEYEKTHHRGGVCKEQFAAAGAMLLVSALLAVLI